MGRKIRPPNLHDVARLAGVSYQTVSRVINGHPYVAPETRDRVLKAIEELDYHPNQAARSLITGRSQTIHLVTTNLYFYNPVPAMVQTARQHGYVLILTPIASEVTPQEIRVFVNNLKSASSDGVLVLNSLTNFQFDVFQQACEGKIPLLQVDGNVNSSVSSVRINQQLGARLAAEHIINLGHRQIAEIIGPRHNFDSIQRAEVTQAILSERGLKLAATQEGRHTAIGGFQAANQLLDDKTNFTALICGNDESAIGAIYALQQRNIRVPDDVSVIGFDDIPTSSFIHPPLTTIRQVYSQLGEQAVLRLIEFIEHPAAEPSTLEIAPELIIRQSTKQIAQ